MRKFLKNVKGAISARAVTGLAVSALIVAILLPIALGTIANATTTNWSTSVKTVFTIVLPILVVVGVAMKYLPSGKGG